MADPRDLAKLHEEAVEKAVKAYWADATPEPTMDTAIRAYLAHVAAAGWKLTPREADQAMVKAGLDAIRDSRNIWQAQHAAAPALPPGEG